MSLCNKQMLAYRNYAETCLDVASHVTCFNQLECFISA